MILIVVARVLLSSTHNSRLLVYVDSMLCIDDLEKSAPLLDRCSLLGFATLSNVARLVCIERL